MLSLSATCVRTGDLTKGQMARQAFSYLCYKDVQVRLRKRASTITELVARVTVRNKKGSK